MFNEFAINPYPAKNTNANEQMELSQTRQDSSDQQQEMHPRNCDPQRQPSVPHNTLVGGKATPVHEDRFYDGNDQRRQSDSGCRPNADQSQ